MHVTSRSASTLELHERPRLRSLRISRLERSDIRRHHVAIADRLKNGDWRHCSSAARSISDSLTPVLNLHDLVFIFFLLLNALEFFWLHGTIIIFVYNNNKCGLLPQHVHCHRLITHCSHSLLNFQLPTGFVLVGQKIVIVTTTTTTTTTTTNNSY